jgi:hypothetical protein
MYAMPSMSVFCSDFLNDFEMLPLSPVIAGITFVSTLEVGCFSVLLLIIISISISIIIISCLSELRILRMRTYLGRISALMHSAALMFASVSVLSCLFGYYWC